LEFLGHIPSHLQQQGGQRRRLEFIHIPKTGGTVIEKVAGTNGVAWTICHFMPSQAVTKMSMNIIHCPQPSSTHVDDVVTGQLDRRSVPTFHGLVWWHLPPSYFFEYRGVLLPDQNPYQGADLFAVVRNPYDRLLSEYYYQQTYLVSEADRKQTQNVKYMNRWVTTNLQAYAHASCDKSTKRYLSRNTYVTAAYLRKDGHFIPQYDFVYNLVAPPSPSSLSSKPKKVVHHVLKFETLRHDFYSLMHEYGLDRLIPLPRETIRKSLDKKLGLHNLTSANLQLIEQVYAQDFDAFDYPIQSTVIPGEILNRNDKLMKYGSSSSILDGDEEDQRKSLEVDAFEFYQVPATSQ
jgi:hypothetical protein